MDPDFYFEESNPKKVAFFIILLIILLGASGYYFYLKYMEKVIKLNDVTIELGDTPSENIEDYAKGNLEGYTLILADNLSNEEGKTYFVGEYSYKLKKGVKQLKGKIFVEDNTPPVVEVQNITVGLNEEFEPYEFLVKCDDLSLPCTTSYKNEKDKNLNSKIGTYTLDINISDKYGNITTKEVNLTVSESESLLSKKQHDMEVSKMTPEDEEWNKTYSYKFDKAVLEESEEFQSKLFELTSIDFSEVFDKEITNQYIITIYNKYDYIIGLSIKLFFNDNTVKYVLPSEIPEVKEENSQEDE